MKRHYPYLLSAKIVLIIFLLSACSNGGKKSTTSFEGEELPMHYAENLAIWEHESYTVAQLLNPWNRQQILHTYVLVDKNSPLPQQLPAGTLIRTPLTKIIVYSAVHCSLINQLGAIESIAGVCDLNYIKLPIIQERHAAGLIADMGEAMAPNIEKIIDLNPDAVWLSPFENSGGYGKIEKLNIPLIECADYMETSALGRAEWMRFFGLLLGKSPQAESTFEEVSHRYNELKNLANRVTKRPTVMSDLKSSSTWYTPGGKSTVAGLYADAGADYLFKEDQRSGSFHLSFELMYERGQHADFWIIKYNQAKDKTYSELKSDFGPYSAFKAYKERQIYGCNTNRIPFYEESPFHPDLHLKEFIKIFHPTLLPTYNLTYFSNLAE
ncbi:MAG: ABC transporter substrate-binding protein [Phocaeicola sp.]